MPKGIEEHIADRLHMLLTGAFDQPFSHDGSAQSEWNTVWVLLGFESWTKSSESGYFGFSVHFLKTCLFKVEIPIRSILSSDMCCWSVLFQCLLHFVHFCPCCSCVFFVCRIWLCSETGKDEDSKYFSVKELFTKPILFFPTQFLPCFTGKLTSFSKFCYLSNNWFPKGSIKKFKKSLEKLQFLCPLVFHFYYFTCAHFIIGPSVSKSKTHASVKEKPYIALAFGKSSLPLFG